VSAYRDLEVSAVISPNGAFARLLQRAIREDELVWPWAAEAMRIDVEFSAREFAARYGQAESRVDRWPAGMPKTAEKVLRELWPENAPPPLPGSPPQRSRDALGLGGFGCCMNALAMDVQSEQVGWLVHDRPPSRSRNLGSGLSVGTTLFPSRDGHIRAGSRRADGGFTWQPQRLPCQPEAENINDLLPSQHHVMR
jgi:hypothetical protein